MNSKISISDEDIINNILKSLRHDGVTEHNVLMWKGYLYGLYDWSLKNFYLDVLKMFPDIGFKELYEIDFSDLIYPEVERELKELAEQNNRMFDCKQFFNKLDNLDYASEKNLSFKNPLEDFQQLKLSALKKTVLSHLSWRGATDALVLLWKGYLTALIHGGYISYETYIDILGCLTPVGNHLLFKLYGGIVLEISDITNASTQEVSLEEGTDSREGFLQSTEGNSLDCCQPGWSATDRGYYINWYPSIAIDQSDNSYEAIIKQLVTEYADPNKDYFVPKTLILRGYLVGLLEIGKIDENAYFRVSRCLYNIGYPELIFLVSNTQPSAERYDELMQLTRELNNGNHSNNFPSDNDENVLDLILISSNCKKIYDKETLENRAYKQLELPAPSVMAHLIWSGYILALYENKVIEYDTLAFMFTKRIAKVANRELCELFSKRPISLHEEKFITLFVDADVLPRN
ncbi:MAG: hypothetical protein IPP74_06550 [Alphaproteobacteria bacterium]|nr:hypothetical protein [Alphaproteobacteria bacterium]